MKNKSYRYNQQLVWIISQTGLSHPEIARLIGCSRPTVIYWNQQRDNGTYKCQMGKDSYIKLIHALPPIIEQRIKDTKSTAKKLASFKISLQSILQNSDHCLK